MPTTLEDVRETFTGQPRRRWLPWRRKPTLAERVGDVTGQVGQTTSTIAGQVGQTTSNIAGQVSQTASDLAGQVAQTTSDLVGRARDTTTSLAKRGSEALPSTRSLQRRVAFRAGKTVGRLSNKPLLSVPTPRALQERMFQDEPSAPGRWYDDSDSRADLSAERAADAAEVAARAAQRAVGLLERVTGWMPLLASRAPEPMPLQPLLVTPPQASLLSQPPISAPTPLASLTPVAAPAREEEGLGKRVPRVLRRAAMNVGQRVNDLSDGRYGLETQAPKAETKPEKNIGKRIEQRARREAKEEQPASGVRWLPWALGLSLGLVFGLVGVAYWQRRRLQSLWQQTSQRMQQTTEDVRQRIEARRSEQSQVITPTPSQTIQSDVRPGTPTFTPLGSAAPATDMDRQVNGWRESPTE